MVVLREKSDPWGSTSKRLRRLPEQYLAKELMFCRSLDKSALPPDDPGVTNATAYLDMLNLTVIAGGTEHLLGRWDQAFCHWARDADRWNWQEFVIRERILTATGKPDTDALIQALTPKVGSDISLIRRYFTIYLTEIPTHYRRLAAPFKDAQWAILRSIWLDPDVAYMVDTEITCETRSQIQRQVSRHLSQKLKGSSIGPLVQVLDSPGPGRTTHPDR